MEALVAGTLLQSSLIFALGPQNIFVLESGLHKRRHLLTAFLCSLCDTLLIGLGVLGVGTLFIQYPKMKVLFGVLGVIFLAYYGALKMIEKPAFQSPSKNEENLAKASAVITYTLAFSLLNPHVYLDTVVLIGSYAGKFPHILHRLQFGLGAAIVSIVWFFGLATLSAQLGKVLKSARALRLIYFTSGCILVGLSINLGLEVWNWYRLLFS